MALAHLNRSPSYLSKTPYSYGFRIRIPLDLQPQIGKKELRYSLKTGYLSEAKSKARLMAGQVQQLFRTMRRETRIMTELTTEQIDEIIKEYVRTALDVEKQVTMNWDHGPLSSYVFPLHFGHSAGTEYVNLYPK